jgi:predicted ester cyclase
MRTRLSLMTVLGAATLVTVAACERPSRANQAIAANKALVLSWFEDGFNNHNPMVVDGLFASEPVINGTRVPRDGVKQNMNRHLSGFPDLHVTIDEVVAEDQKVTVWYTVEGTHSGEFESVAPTGRRVKWAGVDLFTIERNRITEARFLSDLHGLLMQLDATSSAHR